MVCLVIFTLSSLLCGIATSLGTIILFRVLQGTGGGGLQPYEHTYDGHVLNIAAASGPDTVFCRRRMPQAIT